MSGLKSPWGVTIAIIHPTEHFGSKTDHAQAHLGAEETEGLGQKWSSALFPNHLRIALNFIFAVPTNMDIPFPPLCSRLMCWNCTICGWHVCWSSNVMESLVLVCEFWFHFSMFWGGKLVFFCQIENDDFFESKCMNLNKTYWRNNGTVVKVLVLQAADLVLILGTPAGLPSISRINPWA